VTTQNYYSLLGLEELGVSIIPLLVEIENEGNLF